MKVNFTTSLDLRAGWLRLQWQAHCLYRRMGPLPLLLLGIWLSGVLYWALTLRPELLMQKHSLDEIRHELSVPLPMLSAEQSTMQDNLSITEYQQVKALFAIFNKYHLQVQESRYQFIAADADHPAQLALDIPLQGDYQQFYLALRELTASMPVKVNAATLRRKHPDLTGLQIMLRVTLRGGEA
ncbi:hypothetical protein GW590_21285 [Rahnella sp. SAP-1]|uniref:Uncharacterized protein n=1 Tax=Rouxiella aceris TaxID=2703884 RepID=A0A848MRA0_9GAMM|nr:hypothetical protein [Rouxiella aceris]NMP29382.1 hypothetical protein [Rouxiella aceris]